MKSNEIHTTIKNYILSEFLPGEDPENLDESVQLVSDGILNSMASLKLVAFLEETFGVALEAHEVDAEHLDSIDTIVGIIEARR